MEQPAGPSLLDHFAVLEDPRQQAKVLYPLPEILLLLLCATLAGADDLVEIEVLGNQQLGFLRRFRPYPTASRATTRWGPCSACSTPRCSRPASPPGWRG